MVTSKVAQIAAMLGSPDLLQTQKQQQGTEAAFGAFLNQTSVDRGQQKFSANENVPVVKTEMSEQAVYEKETAKSSYRENTISHEESSNVEDKLPEDTAEKLKTFEKKVKEAVAEELGISEEELTEQMEAMGLTVLDLVDPSKLAGLVLELTGSEDISGLLLSQDFQQILSQITELSQELGIQLNLTPEELGQVMDKLEAMLTEESQEILTQDIEEMPIEQSDTPADIVPESEKQAGIAQTSVQNPEEDVNSQKPQERTELQAEQGNADVTVQGQEEQSETKDNSAAKESFSELTQNAEGNEKAETPKTHVTYQTTVQTVNQGQGVEVTQTIVQTKVNVEDILRQVSQMTRVFVGQAESSIEMQLNPANLGKVYLQVVSRDGVITAQLAAQNEAVKEALESQLVVLKENMDQQGMKVEAIEVTVASHGFERNLEENQKNAARQQQEEEMRKSGRRNLNLNNLDELEGLMSEEESLVAKIMAEQGNSLNITA